MSTPRIVVATGNAHKTGEIAAALQRAGLSIEVVSAKAVGGMPEVDETGQTFAANARLKAEALRLKATPGDWVLADDSGLEVDALDGAPGIYSARYAGPDATDADNMAKLLDALQGRAPHERGARFACCLVLLGTGFDQTFTGHCPGQILEQPIGDAGFGYDPLFAPDGYEESFAQLGAVVKDRISHRAHACQLLATWLRERALTPRG
ncbi:RdgB/HAM1 family non-canonical purine NTP pyrophosphatase [Cerasicoccus arenae]|uniref:dITP/XTP pyrophosphatase n=1 Tax=Cerasicoccus arenae TaxID=424488 RepID=A0A8J3GEV1_9BACT|nr:RdgB/HAM1 family non-canonical purine NTP pyrophosphatase [Cerasicoccus arenae]MBK1857793.1 RdgB/HAM1 family non-canonical purine NTP pyrophosphatase [Cerasicoccus arenae]GHC12090.1 non-canonical purine NTP pyrophosphatase [Cerasicoccus arenae]